MPEHLLEFLLLDLRDIFTHWLDVFIELQGELSSFLRNTSELWLLFCLKLREHKLIDHS